MQSVLLIDWENFKWKMKAIFSEHKKQKPEWHTYNFKALFDKTLQGITRDKIIFYFAKIKEDADTKDKSKKLIEEQRLLKNHLEKQGFEVVLIGRVRGYVEKGFLGKNITVFKEKGVDVKIAIDMVSWSCDKKVNQIILASSDSDLQPAISEIRKRNVKCIYLGFESQPNKGISYNTDRTILIRDAEILDLNI